MKNPESQLLRGALTEIRGIRGPAYLPGTQKNPIYYEIK